MQSTRLIAALAGFVALASADCARDNCLRAVVASAFTTRSGIPDCNSFMLSTVIPATSTATVTVTATATDATTVTTTATSIATVNALVGTDTITATATATVTGAASTVTSTANGVLKRRGRFLGKRQSAPGNGLPAPAPTTAAATTIRPSVMPAYASTACKANTASYLYACSCVGATAGVTTLATPVTTVTVTSTLATVFSAAATATVDVTDTITVPTTATTFVTVTNTATVPGNTVVSVIKGCSQPDTFYLKIANGGPYTGLFLSRATSAAGTVSIGITSDPSQAVLFAYTSGNGASGNLVYRPVGSSGRPSTSIVSQDNGLVFADGTYNGPDLACATDPSNFVRCKSGEFSATAINDYQKWLQLYSSDVEAKTPIQLQAVCSLS